jgi:hypothetical protein
LVSIAADAAKTKRPTPWASSFQKGLASRKTATLMNPRVAVSVFSIG